jgi:hypothetical protein
MECLRKNDCVLKIFIVKINKTTRMQFSLYGRQTENYIYAACCTKPAWIYSCARLSAIGVVMVANWQFLQELASSRQKAAYVWRMAETKSVTSLQGKFRMNFCHPHSNCQLACMTSLTSLRSGRHVHPCSLYTI